MDNLTTLFMVVLCLVLEALFSGGELALVAADSNRIRQKAGSGSRSARLTLKLLENPEWFLATTLTGTSLCVVTGTTVATALFLSTFGTARGEILSVIVMIPTILVLGEIIPKSIFQRHAEFIAMKLSWFIYTASWLLFPVVFVISRISRKAVYRSPGTSGRSSSHITRGGLKYILGGEETGGDILITEKDMIRRIIDFPEITAGRIMSPLSTMTALPVTATIREASRLAAEKKYLRIPVYQDRIFNITGILHYFDLLEALHSEGAVPPLSPDDTIASCVKPAVFYVPETKPAKELLVELRARGERIAVVVDEYGGAVGIVTMEDIVEEIVGEIDEGYEGAEKRYRKIGVGKYIFSARISLERLHQLIPLDIPEGDYETLGGFLLYEMGRIPKRKETLQYGAALFVIEDADAKSIREVLVTLPPGAELKNGT